MFGGEPRVLTFPSQTPHKAVPRWTIDYLNASAGDLEVWLRCGDALSNIYRQPGPPIKARLREYLKWVTDPLHATIGEADPGKKFYLDVPLAQLGSALVDDVSAPRWFASPPLIAVFWCGVLGSSSGLHYDDTPNCNMQVAGEKRFVLFPPRSGWRLGRLPRKTHYRFDPNASIGDQPPGTERLSGWETILRAGECIYIPAGWPHQVTTVSSWAMNVNFFWPLPPLQGLAHPSMWSMLLQKHTARLRKAMKLQ
jgi:hypothetical protein